MKRILCVLICAAMAVCARAEGSHGAELRFLSFDGGGHVYTVEIGDPSVLACEGERDYRGEDPELVDGASFDQLFRFTGLAPGRTAVNVYGRSPILENDDHAYTATVDDALNVTLEPLRAISTFFLSRNGEIYYDSYHITREPDGYRVSVSDGEAQGIDGASMEALMGVIDKYGLEGWDGFDGSTPYVLDGEGFWLEFTLTDGTHVQARGDNAFPEEYFPAMGEIWRILENAEIGETEEETMKLTIGGEAVPVTWEENESVEALKTLAPLEIELSMYGGFEQVGPIGQSLPRDDKQTTTAAGDIVLYSGNQIVVFYGSNSWAYTRLGHVDLPAADMARLLGNGDVTIAIQ